MPFGLALVNGNVQVLGAKMRYWETMGSKNAINILPTLCAPLGLLGCSAFGHDQICNDKSFVRSSFVCNLIKKKKKWFLKTKATQAGFI